MMFEATAVLYKQSIGAEYIIRYSDTELPTVARVQILNDDHLGYCNEDYRKEYIAFHGHFMVVEALHNNWQ